MPELQLESITKKYGSVMALNDINLKSDAQEFLVVLGPSGAGKTTLLKVIAGLEKMNSGKVKIDGVDIKYIPPWKRNISMVFENYALYPHLTVFENLAFPLKANKLPLNEINDRVKEIASLLEIENYLSRLPKALSGGQRQRVSLGRALVRKELALMLFDEPLAHLDAKLQHRMRRELKSLCSNCNINTTIIYVTHEYQEALALASRIVVLKDGQIQQVGTPKQIYENPKNIFVAQFVGDPPMNLCTSKVDKFDDKAVFNIGEKNVFVDLTQKPVLEKYIGKFVTFGIRPIDMRASVGEAGQLDGELFFVEKREAMNIATIKTGEKNFIKSLWTSNRIPGLGENVNISFDYNKLLIFDKDNGDNLDNI